jgi:hypothetical protein
MAKKMSMLIFLSIVLCIHTHKHTKTEYAVELLWVALHYEMEALARVYTSFLEQVCFNPGYPVVVS